MLGWHPQIPNVSLAKINTNLWYFFLTFSYLSGMLRYYISRLATHESQNTPYNFSDDRIEVLSLLPRIILANLPDYSCSVLPLSINSDKFYLYIGSPKHFSAPLCMLYNSSKLCLLANAPTVAGSSHSFRTAFVEFRPFSIRNVL